MPRATPAAIVVATLSLLTELAAQESAALLHAALAVLPVDSAPFQRLADFDGDGDLDAIGTRVHGNGSNNEIVIWRNDGGAFTTAWSGSAPIYLTPDPTNPIRTLALATGDFNQDGLADFVVAGGSNTQRFVSAATGTFTTHAIAAPGIAITHVATGDFDADGSLDYVVVGKSLAGPGVSVQAFLAAGGAPTWTVPGSTGAELRVQAAARSGQPGDDLLVFDRSSSIAAVLRLVGGQLTLDQVLVSSIAMPVTTVWKWIAGDLDGDHDTDVIVFRPGQGQYLATYQVFRRTSASTLTPEPPQNGGPSEYLADIDGDGDLDGVCCGGGGGPTYGWPTLDFPSMFQIAENRGGGDFAFSWNFPGTGSLSMAGAADIDGDGDVDFVAGRCVFYGRGPWTGHPTPTAGGANSMLVNRRHDLGDTDRDGDPDLLGMRNRGDGTMDPINDQVAPPPGRTFGGSIRIDVDGDGAPDRIQRQLVGGLFEYMVLQRNNGGGHYRYAGACAPTGLRFGSQYAYTADHYLAADCDGDGDEDVIANSNPANSEGYYSQIFWNNAGMFSAGPSLNARIDAVADFDADGLPDLLTSTGSVTLVLRGTGDVAVPFVGQWQGPAKPFEPNALVVADLDDDGRLDFAAPTGPSTFLLFMNVPQVGWPFYFIPCTLTGVGVTIAPSGGGAVVRSPVAAADFDGDGMTDLMLGRTSGEPNVSTILRRISWSNPPSLANYVVLKQVTPGGFAGDADGDGDIDLIGDVVTLNPLHHGSAAGGRMQSLPGIAGEDGATPVFGASGPFRCGETVALRLTGVPGPTLALLCMSLGTATQADVPLPGLTLYVDPATLISGVWAIGEDGQGRAAASATLPVYLPPGLQGLTFHLQAFVPDPSAPTTATQTNLLTATIGW